VDPDGKAIAPSNKEGQDAIENYFSRFRRRILNKAFGLKKTNHSDSRNGKYTTYFSSHTQKLDANSFYKHLRNMNAEEKQEAYAVYTALIDEGLYTVGVWCERQETESYSYQTPTVISEGTILLPSIPGFASPAVSKNRAYDTDLKNISEGNFSGLFSIENHQYFNGNDVFTNKYNFYINYNDLKKLPNNYNKSIGCLIFNGNENTKYFGEAFRKIIFY